MPAVGSLGPIPRRPRGGHFYAKGSEMCVYSMVLDGAGKLPWPWHEPGLGLSGTITAPERVEIQGFPNWANNLTLGEIQQLREMIVSFKDLAAAAKKLDEAARQPDCEDPEKQVLENRIAELERQIAAIALAPAPAAHDTPPCAICNWPKASGADLNAPPKPGLCYNRKFLECANAPPTNTEADDSIPPMVESSAVEGAAADQADNSVPSPDPIKMVACSPWCGLPVLDPLVTISAAMEAHKYQPPNGVNRAFCTLECAFAFAATTRN